MHSWNISVKDAISLQKKLSKIVIYRGKPEKINFIAGVDLAYDKNSNLGFCSIVLLSYPDSFENKDKCETCFCFPGLSGRY